MPSKNPRPKIPDYTADGKCGALTRQGGYCKRKLGANTDHPGVGRCSSHGGKAPAVERKHGIARAKQELQVMGEPVPIHPIDAILRCVEIANGEVDYCNLQIAKLKQEDAAGPEITTRPLKFEKGAESSTERVYEEGPPALHIWIQARYEAMNRLAYYSKLALAANVAERQAQLAEKQAHMLATAVKGILTEAGIVNRPDMPAIVRRHLELVSGNAIDGTLAA